LINTFVTRHSISRKIRKIVYRVLKGALFASQQLAVKVVSQDIYFKMGFVINVLLAPF